jgi:hypothetical protein
LRTATSSSEGKSALVQQSLLWVAHPVLSFVRSFLMMIPPFG